MKKYYLQTQTLLLFAVFYLSSPFISIVRFAYINHFNNKFTYFSSIATAANWVVLIGGLMVFVPLLVYWANYFVNRGLDKKHLNTLIIIVLLLTVFNGIASSLLSLNEIRYQNYVYSSFGIFPKQLQAMIIANYFCLGIIVSFFFVKQSKRIKINKHSNNLYLATLNVFAVLLALGMSLYPFFKIRNLWQTGRDGYDKKMGRHYQYIESLVLNTPEEAVIIHPPQGNEFPAIGNQPVIRYFLYPRILISGAVINSSDVIKPIKKDIYFIEIPESSENPAWPEINLISNLISFDGKNWISYQNLERLPEDIYNIYKIKF